jgi:hypothetical protein
LWVAKKEGEKILVQVGFWERAKRDEEGKGNSAIQSLMTPRGREYRKGPPKRLSSPPSPRSLPARPPAPSFQMLEKFPSYPVFIFYALFDSRLVVVLVARLVVVATLFAVLFPGFSPGGSHGHGHGAECARRSRLSRACTSAASRRGRERTPSQIEKGVRGTVSSVGRPVGKATRTSKGRGRGTARPRQVSKEGPRMHRLRALDGTATKVNHHTRRGASTQNKGAAKAPSYIFLESGRRRVVRGLLLVSVVM